MTLFVLVRDANPDYSVAKSQGISQVLAPLSNVGVEQAKKLSKDSIFENAEILICSPFTRAKQTAQYILQYKDVPISAEYNLRKSKLFRPGMLRKRKEAMSVINRYLDYKKVIVVTHAEIILFLTGKWIEQGEYLLWEHN